jgi:general secretion pathway protein L
MRSKGRPLAGMDFLRRLAVVLSRWIDDACRAIMSIDDLIRPKRKFEVVEQEDLAFLVRALGRGAARRAPAARLRFVEGQFAEDADARAGSRVAGGEVEIVLARRRFVFRTLELPQQASGFLDAIIRSQIDRLTPWSPSQAAFGCSAPTEISGGRIGVVVAATARASVMPFVTALEALKPSSIVVSAASDGADDEAQRRTVVFAQQSNRESSMRRVRGFLVAGPAAAGIVALGAFAAWLFVGANLDEARDRISRQMAERRVALLSGRPGVLEESAAKLAQRKRESPAAVIVLESLSQALPDDTYLTELHVADGKVQITGVTREAASLIQIIEQTDQFKKATFFAPTTRAPTEVGEQFHIEAQVVPYFPTVP